MAVPLQLWQTNTLWSLLLIIRKQSACVELQMPREPETGECSPLLYKSAQLTSSVKLRQWGALQEKMQMIPNLWLRKHSPPWQFFTADHVFHQSLLIRCPRCSVDSKVVPALPTGCFATKPNPKDESPHRHTHVCLSHPVSSFHRAVDHTVAHKCIFVFRYWWVPGDPGGLWKRRVHQHGWQLPVRMSRGVLL